MNIDVTVISWRDIPAQVQVGSGRSAVRKELPSRFQVAIDRAAMEAGLIGTDEYLTEWRRETVTVDAEDAEAACARLIAQLVAEYPSDTLQQIAGNAGLQETT